MVDLDRLRELAQAATMRLATENELGDICPDCELGAVSPFARQHRWRVFVDRCFVGEPEMVFCAGTHTDAITMHFADFSQLTSAIVGAIGVAWPTIAGDPPQARRLRARPSNLRPQGAA
jgi:Ala-tRNA(Pro) deacylase